MSINTELFPFYSKVPQSVSGQAEYRRTMLTAAYACDEAKEELWIKCSRDELYFFNVMLFTYDPRREFPAVPFNTYGFQDRAIEKFKRSYGNDDCLIEKSRDMGASWISLGFLFHRWMFMDLQSILIGSRKQEYVDKRGDKKALFAKFDFMLEYLPKWMIPTHTRTQLHLLNEMNGSTIDGESTNSDFGRGDRRTVVFLDEFASVETGYQVESATRDVTRCRWYNSTPKGVGNAFYEKREKLSKLRPDSIIRMHWSEHPEKAEGLYSSRKMEDDEHYQLEKLHDGFEYEDGYPFILDGKLRSPWYDEQCFRAANQQEIAQELDIDYQKSGWRFFDNIEAIMARDGNPAFVEGELIYNVHKKEKPIFSPQPGGRLKLWVKLDINDDFMRTEEFSIGCDVATGSGGDHSSNSVASVVGRVSGRKVAEFATNMMSPEEYADYVIAMCRYFHSENQDIPAFLIWEGNGPGVQFGKRIRDRNYGRIYYRRNEQSDSKKATDSPGWWTDKKTKKMLLGEYGSALKTGKFRNPSMDALKELNEYVHEPTGDIVHSRSKALKDIDPTASGENHGDRVIADALAWRGRAYVIKSKPKTESREAPPGSMAHRMQIRKKEELASTLWED